ncbi:MAG: GNAT family N-acetyltransferase [Bacteroidetes bacterium]|nr:GNAT family N-acetyltransferase [Bacteroidota bacterium]
MNRFATKRTVIRPLETADSAAVFAYRSDPDVVRYQMWRPARERDVRSFIRDMRGLAPGMPGIWYQFGIILQQNGELIGDCGVHMPLDDPECVELGLTLRSDFQRQGYAQEVLRALIRYSFETLHVHRVIARMHPENKRSLELIKRCHFTPLTSDSSKTELAFELRYTNWSKSL